MKKFIRIIIIAAFTLQGSGIGNHLSNINNRLSTNHALRPMAANLPSEYNPREAHAKRAYLYQQRTGKSAEESWEATENRPRPIIFEVLPADNETFSAETVENTEQKGKKSFDFTSTVEPELLKAFKSLNVMYDYTFENNAVLVEVPWYSPKRGPAMVPIENIQDKLNEILVELEKKYTIANGRVHIYQHPKNKYSNIVRLILGEDNSKSSFLNKKNVYTRNESFANYFRKLDFIEASIVLNKLIFFDRNNYTTLPEQEKLFLLGKALSVALSSDNKDAFKKELKQILETSQTTLSPKSRILIKSYLSVEEIDRPVSVCTVNAMYHEQQRMQKPSQAKIGEDALRLSIQQMEDLYGINPLIDWRLIVVNDGDDRNDKDIRYKQKSSDIANRILIEEFSKYYSGKGLTGSKVQVLDMDQEIKDAIGSVKGGAIIYGMRKALDNGAEYVIYTDQDKSINLSQEGVILKQLVNGESDAVLGLRHGHDAAIKRSLGNQLRHYGFKLYVSGIIPIIRNFVDTQAALKGFKNKALEAIIPLNNSGEFDPFFEYGGAFDVNIIGRLVKSRARIQEVPICYYESPLSTFSSPSSAYKMAAGVWREKNFLKTWTPRENLHSTVYSNLKEVIRNLDSAA